MAVFEATYEYTDEDGDIATHSLFILDTFTLTQVTECFRSMAQLLDAVIKGIVSACSFTIDVDLSGLSNNVIDGSADVDDIAGFQFSTVNGDLVDVNIPCMIETVVPAGSDDLDLSDPAVAAFRTAMTSGIAVTGGTIAPCDVDEQDINALVYARENFRPSGRRR